MITNSCGRNRPFRRFSAPAPDSSPGPPEAEPCDRMGEARDVRLSSKSRKTHALIGQLGACSPELKPGHCKMKRSRGFENPLPGLKSGAGTDQAVGCYKCGAENVETPHSEIRFRPLFPNLAVMDFTYAPTCQELCSCFSSYAERLLQLSRRFYRACRRNSPFDLSC
jgi:hypothetical protein